MGISTFDLQESTNRAIKVLEKSIEMLKANLLISKGNDAIELFNSEMANIIVRCGEFLGGKADFNIPF